MRSVIFLLCLLLTCTLPAQVPGASVLRLRAPATFRAVFKTTKGDFEIVAHRSWSPLGVDRLYQLIRSGFYNNTLLFRVEPKYVIQFGIADLPSVNHFWDPKKIADELPQQKHTRGTMAFARDVPNSRATQLFIDAVDNPKLDTATRAGVNGYPPVARVVKGMEIILSFYSHYGRTTLSYQDSVYLYGNKYMQKKFPGLDRIISAAIIE